MTQINEPKQFIIEKQKILLVEGKDEVAFFEAFLNKFQKRDSIQIIDFGGKYKFKKDFPTLKNTSGFNRVTSLAIIQDANDEGPQRRFESINSILKNNNLPAPDKMASFTLEKPQIGIFIMPDCQNKGMLETLCLSIVESKDIKKCIDEFMDCMNKNLDSNKFKKPKNKAKAHLRAFLSAMEEDTPHLGVAAQKGYWNFNSDKLKLLLNFLNNLSE